MDEIEALSQLLAKQNTGYNLGLEKKKPYSEMYGEMLPVAPPAPSSEPIKQEPITIESTPLIARPQFIQPVPGAPKTAPGQFVMKNVNEMLEAGQQKQELSKEEEALINQQYQEALQKMGSSIPEGLSEYKPDVSRRDQINQLAVSLKDAGSPGEKSMLTEAILSLGPALLGAGFGGNAGYRSAAPAGQQAREIFEMDRRSRQESAKQNADAIKMQIKSLEDLEKQDKDAFYRDQRTVLTLADLKIKNETNFATLKGKELADAKKQNEKIEEMMSKLDKDGVFKIADIESKDLDRKSKEREAGILSKLYKGEEAVDVNFAKDWQEYAYQGGASNSRKNITELDGVLKFLEGGGSNRFVNFLPKKARELVAPDGVFQQEKVESVIKQTLRDILGGQFAFLEGQSLVENSYNPRLTPLQNAERLKGAINELESRLKTFEESGRYFSKYGTLSPRITGAGIAVPLQGLKRFDNTPVDRTPPPEPSNRDQKAIDWLKNNPEHPNAKKIREHLIQKGALQ